MCATYCECLIILGFPSILRQSEELNRRPNLTSFQRGSPSLVNTIEASASTYKYSFSKTGLRFRSSFARGSQLLPVIVCDTIQRCPAHLYMAHPFQRLNSLFITRQVSRINHFLLQQRADFKASAHLSKRMIFLNGNDP